MECELSPENGPSCSKTRNEGNGLRNIKYEHRHIGGRKVRLGVPSNLLGEALDRQMYLSMVPVDRTTQQPLNTPPDIPFMNNMDEISYWIYTKRAPCLMNYDNIMKKQNEEVTNTITKPKTVPNVVQEVPSLKKKKKRKLSSLNDDSVSDGIQKNVYFDNSQKQVHKTASSSDGLGSNIDFDIKNLTTQQKNKRSKLQKSSKRTTLKKRKIATSTPKPTSLRRSLRHKQQNLNNGHMNASFNFESTGVNGNNFQNTITIDETDDKLKEQSEMLAAGDQTCDKKKTSKMNIVNGQFEDLSDMSGFTANYIRSTKVQSKKTPRKLKCKTSKNLIKESRHNEQKDCTTTVCVNKTVNTRQSKNTLLDSSKDSSQNVISLVTVKNNGNCSKVDKDTSILKFLDTSNKESIEDSKHKKEILNATSKPTSRYPRRSRNVKANNTQLKNTVKNCSGTFDKSERKENPEEQFSTPRTRSGRNIGLTLGQPENSVLVLSNSSEDKSSLVSMNVARTNEKLKRKKCVAKRAVNTQKSGQSRDSDRDKSGFAACFSDSEDDSLPLVRRFFCA